MPTRVFAALAVEVHVFCTAVMFLTRIPVPRRIGHDPAWLARSTAYFPLVGVVVGLAGGLVVWGAGHVWPPTVAAALSTAATVWATGAFHEDALADSCDGFGGGWDRDQVLAIMKDSRIGSYGAVGLGLALITKVAAVAAIAAADGRLALRVLVAAHVLGRWSSLPLIWGLPYVREGGGSKSRPFAASVTGPRLAAGTAVAVAAVALALDVRARPAAVAGALLLAAAVTAFAARYFRRRLGGMTGDCLGAANQVVELATYLLFAAAWQGRR